MMTREMPTYSYRCTECGTAFDIVQSFSDDSLTECPTCGGRLRKLYNAVGVVFKGGGFYRNDSRTDGKGAKSASSGDSSSSSGGSSDSSSSTGSSSESSSSSSSTANGSSSSGSGSSTGSGASTSSSTTS